MLIGIGQLPNRPRPLRKRRTLPYTLPDRARRNINAACTANPVDTDLVLFDQKAELPIARLHRARTSYPAKLSGDLTRWFGLRWQWLRPRTIPVAVALVGMICVIQAVNYLSRPPVQVADLRIDDARPTTTSDTPPMCRIRVILRQ